MGGNGSRGKGLLNSELGRNWKTVVTIGDIQAIQLKDSTKSNKLPEESRSTNRIYSIFEKNGSDVKAIAKYDSNGKKIWEIHTTDHKGLGAHFHLWKDGKPIKGSETSLVGHPDLLAILNKVRNFK